MWLKRKRLVKCKRSTNNVLALFIVGVGGARPANIMVYGVWYGWYGIHPYFSPNCRKKNDQPTFELRVAHIHDVACMLLPLPCSRLARCSDSHVAA
jgi:hypothetical protein